MYSMESMEQTYELKDVNFDLSKAIAPLNFIRHPFHNICSRICSFPPSMAAYFLSCYTKRNDVCMDFFSGKGTMPLQALLMGRVGIGNDVAPEAYTLTKAKLDPPTEKSLWRFMNFLISSSVPSF